MIDDFKIPPFLQQIVIIAVIFVAFLGMKYTSEILGPLLLSIFLSIIIYPFLMWLKKRGLSYNLAVIVTLVGILALGTAVIGFLVVALAQLIKAIPTLSISSNGFLAQYGNEIINFIVSSIPETDSAGIISMGVFILFSVIFLVYELPQIRNRLIKMMGADNPNLTKTFTLIEGFVEYFVIRAKVNLLYGVGVSAILLLFGIDFAVLWGLLTFVLGFIPYVGIILAAIPPVLVAWAKYGIQGAIVMGLFFVIINTIAESYVFPKLTGKDLQMSVYVVFASVFVWGWALGPVGFFIGVPLTMVIIVYLESFDETRWLASLMGSGEEDVSKKKK
ncbi:AI-2E family transporter [Methanobacterium sp. CWC-01]|uniref:AI-2E family transporter n=1 Tax=Methanobacterium aridiramus TaxID=2584467 RepID=UPI00257647F7|nr:AI-2E family transporter [Methanobacterium sp. CWC-01]WJI10107.1 AI-2E family transporter [Methanobacterium sp. CWC-01]